VAVRESLADRKREIRTVKQIDRETDRLETEKDRRTETVKETENDR